MPAQDSNSGISPLPPLAGAVHVWHADPLEVARVSGLATCAALLDDAERDRAGRFRREEDRLTYVVAHALVRAVLSLHADRSPGDWRFDAGAHGKPSIAGADRHRGLTFNLSHARGRVAVAVALERSLGIDVEERSRAPSLEGLARRYLTDEERAGVAALPPEARPHRLVALWNLKEAYLKARGTGMSLPLRSASFHLEGDAVAGCRLAPAAEDDPSRWTFALLPLADAHGAAIAAARAPGEAIAVAVREATGLPG